MANEDGVWVDPEDQAHGVVNRLARERALGDVDLDILREAVRRAREWRALVAACAGRALRQERLEGALARLVGVIEGLGLYEIACGRPGRRLALNDGQVRELRAAVEEARRELREAAGLPPAGPGG